MNPIQIAIDHAGGQTALASLMGVRQPTVSEWASGDRPVPPKKCVAIEKLMGGVITRRDLRPDDWHLIWPELITADHPAPIRAEAAAA